MASVSGQNKLLMRCWLVGVCVCVCGWVVGPHAFYVCLRVCLFVCECRVSGGGARPIQCMSVVQCVCPVVWDPTNSVCVSVYVCVAERGPNHSVYVCAPLRV